MLPLILYIPFAIALAVLFYFSLRAIQNTARPGRLIPFSFFLAVVLGSSLYLMFGVEEEWAPWVALVIVGLVAIPILTPLFLLLMTIFVSWLGRKPMKWN
jgi:hypothetical protein